MKEGCIWSKQRNPAGQDSSHFARVSIVGKHSACGMAPCFSMPCKLLEL